MFKENVLSGLSWLPLISRMVLAKNPQDPPDVAALKRQFTLFKQSLTLAGGIEVWNYTSDEKFGIIQLFACHNV